MHIADYIAELSSFNIDPQITPMDLLSNIEEIILNYLKDLDESYDIKDGIAIHKSAKVDPTATIKAPAIIGPECYIGSHSLLRGGVYLTEAVIIGPSCEVKHSLVGKNTTFAHFNFVGDSIVGSDVNLEAGAVIANHYNERADKRIFIIVDGIKTDTGLTKFGAVIGDNSKIGANAVTSPGTILLKNSVVGRLELIK